VKIDNLVQVAHNVVIGEESIIVAPLHSPKGVIGSLNLYRLQADFAPEELDLVKLFANHAAIALENAQVHQRLLVASRTDPLTGLGHHGAFTRDGRHFLFCNEGGHHVSVLDVGERAWVKTIETGQGPGHAALSRDGRFFFVVHHHDRVITVIDAVKLEAVKNITIAEGGEQSHAAWFTPDGRFFYVVSGDNALVKVDVASGEVASRIGVGPRSFFFVVKDGEDFPLTE
jgi:hypothetical protein